MNLSRFDYFRPLLVESAVLQDRTPIREPDPLPEGTVAWGGPSNFLGLSDFENGPIFKIIPTTIGEHPPPDPDPLPDEPAAMLITYEELARVQDKTVRISQPGKPQNYVDVALVEEILFREQASGGPYEKFHLFRLTPPTP